MMYDLQDVYLFSVLFSPKKQKEQDFGLGDITLVAKRGVSFRKLLFCEYFCTVVEIPFVDYQE
jgi:hypothetical protein